MLHWKFCPQPERLSQKSSPQKVSQKAAGMTLLEVMVAMFILSIVAIAGLNLLASGTGNLAHREQVFLAGLVAHNQLVNVRLSKNSSLSGELKGTENQSGEDFQWRMTLSRTLDKGFLQAEVFVYAPENTESRLLSLVALIPKNGVRE